MPVSVRFSASTFLVGFQMPTRRYYFDLGYQLCEFVRGNQSFVEFSLYCLHSKTVHILSVPAAFTTLFGIQKYRNKGTIIILAICTFQFWNIGSGFGVYSIQFYSGFYGGWCTSLEKKSNALWSGIFCVVYFCGKHGLFLWLFQKASCQLSIRITRSKLFSGLQRYKVDVLPSAVSVWKIGVDMVHVLISFTAIFTADEIQLNSTHPTITLQHWIVL